MMIICFESSNFSITSTLTSLFDGSQSLHDIPLLNLVYQRSKLALNLISSAVFFALANVGRFELVDDCESEKVEIVVWEGGEDNVRLRDADDGRSDDAAADKMTFASDDVVLVLPW